MGGRELVTAYEPTVFTKSLLDVTVVKDSQSNGCLPNSSSTNKSDWCKAVDKMNDLLNQPVTSKYSPW